MDALFHDTHFSAQPVSTVSFGHMFCGQYHCHWTAQSHASKVYSGKHTATEVSCRLLPSKLSGHQPIGIGRHLSVHSALGVYRPNTTVLLPNSTLPIIIRRSSSRAPLSMLARVRPSDRWSCQLNLSNSAEFCALIGVDTRTSRRSITSTHALGYFQLAAPDTTHRKDIDVYHPSVEDVATTSRRDDVGNVIQVRWNPSGYLCLVLHIPGDIFDSRFMLPVPLYTRWPFLCNVAAIKQINQKHAGIHRLF